jgi:exopolyphosphatase/guanosine-5'-triphosphate,3'-diphosphate pyrophosphatase
VPDDPRGGRVPVAVIDIGSNSGRVVVYRVEAEGGFRIQATTRASLRLVREVEKGHALSDEAIERTVEALRDFRAISVGAGAERSLAVATAALRDAGNAPALLDRLRNELGLEVAILSGEQEAWYGFAGAVRGLPVEHGVLFDLGGGSMQLTRFRERRVLKSWSLPLGSLRLSDGFLSSDPPKSSEIRKLQDHVRAALEQAGIPRLTPGESLVGTGGTVRNLAKVDRKTRVYPIVRIHGYVIAGQRLKAMVAMLASRRARERRSVPGLNEDRGDSIVGGGLAIQTVLESLEARELQVSGQGVREGVAVAASLSTPASPFPSASPSSEALPAPAAVREAALRSLCARFRTFDEEPAARRVIAADALLRCLEPAASEELREALTGAARILDIGRSVDFFDRHEHAADMVLETELWGFSHRGLALLSAILRLAGDEDDGVAPYAPLLASEDAAPLSRAATLLALADDIEERCPRGSPLTLECESGRQEVKVTVPALAGWRIRGLGDRFTRAFGRKLTVIAGGS